MGRRLGGRPRAIRGPSRVCQDLLTGIRGARPERHVQLFRQLQAKWQCYDAYCRVCMGLGVNQILQGLSYYCICHTLVENRSPTTGLRGRTTSSLWIIKFVWKHGHMGFSSARRLHASAGFRDLRSTARRPSLLAGFVFELITRKRVVSLLPSLMVVFRTCPPESLACITPEVQGLGTCPSIDA